MNYKPDYDTEIRTSTSIVQHRTMHIDKIDWEYPFEDPTHFNTYCVPDNEKSKIAQRRKSMLKTIEDNYLDKKVEVADSGGFYHHVYSVGMGSFWPYWEPRPVVIVKGTLGAEWMDWTNISYVEVEDE